MASKVTLSFTTLLVLFTLALADVAPYLDDNGYQASAYGLYPSQTYVTNASLIAPRANIRAAAGNDSTSSDRFVFLTPRGDPVAGTATAPTILEANNNLTLVWSGPTWGAAYPFRVQPYNGSEYLTFWAGVQEDLGYGRGNYYMVSLASTRHFARSLERVDPAPFAFCRATASTTPKAATADGVTQHVRSISS